MLPAFAIPASAEVLVIGLMPGWEPADNPKRGVRKVALRLRDLALQGVRVETFSNRDRDSALRLVRETLDRGGAGVVKLAREVDVPVRLTIQIDSYGLGDTRIPANVRTAANLYQSDGRVWLRVEGLILDAIRIEGR